MGEQFLSKLAEPFSKRVSVVPPSRLRPHASDPAAALRDRLKGIDAKIERLTNLIVDAPGRISATKFRERAERLEAERDEIERRLAQFAADDVTGRRPEDIERLRARVADLPLIWERATPAERNQMLRLTIDRIDVLPSERPKQLEIRWADWLNNEGGSAS